MVTKLLLLDCDSTLSSIEGVDELARARGPEVFGRCVELTDAAMNGEVPVQEVFGRRLELIAPTREVAKRVARRYVETMVPHLEESLAALREGGWTPAIVSGGFAPLIEPLAGQLGIERIEAVPLYFSTDGSYAGYGEDYPTTRSGGKPEVVRRLRAEWQPERVVMVGDGVSDLETRNEVDLFVACLVVVERERVEREAEAVIRDFRELPALLERLG